MCKFFRAKSQQSTPEIRQKLTLRAVLRNDGGTPADTPPFVLPCLKPDGGMAVKVETERREGAQRALTAGTRLASNQEGKLEAEC